MKSMLVVPLEWDGRVNGALACSGWSADAFEARHLEMLRLFCQHVAAALAGASRSAGEDPATVPARSLAEYAHEVRGALHTALGYLSLVAEEPEPRLAEAIAGARRACQQAVEIGDAVLDAAADEQRGATAPPVGQ